MFQIYVQASDGGSPPLSADRAIRVNVRTTRNENSPVFEGNQPFIANINENAELATEVLRLTAADRDTDVRTIIVHLKTMNLLKRLHT